MKTSKGLARTAGFLYLAVAILGGFAHIVRGMVYVPDHAAVTTRNVVTNASLVRLSFVADLVQATLFLVVVLTLYRLMQHVDVNIARAMVLFAGVAAGIICLNMVHQLGALLVATEPAYASMLGADGSDTLVLLLLDLQNAGYLVAQIFFGLWLYPLGLLVYRSGMFPRPLGVVLMLGTIAYLLDVVLQFLAPGLADAINPLIVLLVIISEFSMIAYLLIQGVRTVRPSARPVANSLGAFPIVPGAHPLD